MEEGIFYRGNPGNKTLFHTLEKKNISFKSLTFQESLYPQRMDPFEGKGEKNKTRKEKPQRKWGKHIEDRFGGSLYLLLRLQVVQEVAQLLGLLAELLDDDARARDNLPGVGVLVQLAEASPLTQVLGVSNGHQLDVGVVAESLDQVNVGGLIALERKDGESLFGEKRGKINKREGEKRKTQNKKRKDTNRKNKKQEQEKKTRKKNKKKRCNGKKKKKKKKSQTWEARTQRRASRRSRALTHSRSPRASLP